MSSSISDYAVDSKIQDEASTNETRYQNNNAAKQYGYFCNNADLKAAIVSKAIWVVGKGYDANIRTKTIMEHWTGWGKDTADDILFNLEISKRIYGDAFAEIIKDGDNIINIKPLNSANMVIVCDKGGRIKRYEQLGEGDPIKFTPEEILHLSNNRIGDQIHGTSDIDAVESTILAEMESFDDTKKIMHRQARPLIMFKLGTDDSTKIAAFQVKMDNATRLGENIYIPDDASSVSYEVVQLTPSPMVMQWRDDIRKKFYRSIGLPELLPSGGGDATESGGKIGYLAWEQINSREQRCVELQIYAQLNLKINLIPPSSLAASLEEDQNKDGQTQEMGFQPNDVNAGAGE